MKPVLRSSRSELGSGGLSSTLHRLRGPLGVPSDGSGPSWRTLPALSSTDGGCSPARVGRSGRALGAVARMLMWTRPRAPPWTSPPRDRRGSRVRSGRRAAHAGPRRAVRRASGGSAARRAGPTWETGATLSPGASAVRKAVDVSGPP